MSAFRYLIFGLAGGIAVSALPNAAPRIIFNTDEPGVPASSVEYNPIPEHIFPPGSIPALRPVVPASHDRHNPENLVPCQPGPGAPLHYAQENEHGNYDGGIFGVVTPHFDIHSVVLDHAATTTTVEMLNDNELLIAFDGSSGFLHAMDHWEKMADLVFVTFTPGCGDFEKHDRCYFHSDRLSFYPARRAVIARGQAKAMKDVTSSFTISFGSYHDRNAPGRVLKARQAAEPTVTVTATGVPVPTNAAAEYDFDPDIHECTAPADSKYGLPTACLGEFFDDDLDDDLGFKDATEFSWSDYYLSVFTGRSGSDDTLSLEKRIDWPNPVKKVVDKVVEKGNQLKTATTAAVKNTVGVIQNGAQTIVNGVGNVIFGRPFTTEKGWQNIRVPTPKDSDECKKNDKSCKPGKDAKPVESPWGGDAILMKSFGKSPDEKEIVKGKRTKTRVSGRFLNVYCVDCGFVGGLKLKGTVTIKNIEGITEGSIEAELTSEIKFGLGVFGQWTESVRYDQSFFTIPLSPFTIGAATVGTYATVGGRFELSANLTGHALARADVNLGTAKFKYDLVKKTSTKTNLQPQFVPKFEAEGEITIESSLGIPIALNIGVDFLSGCKKCKGEIGVETYPHIKAEAKFAVEASASRDGKSAGIKASDGCKGVAAEVSLGNKISAKFNGFGLIEKEWDIHEAKGLFPKSWCLGKEVEKRGLLDRRDQNSSNWQSSNTIEAPTNSTTNTSSSVDLTSLVIPDSEFASFDPTDQAILSYPLEQDGLEGYWQTTINYGGKTDDSALFVACNDGNVYIMENKTLVNLPFYQTCQFLWGGIDGVIFDAPGDNILYFYNNTMTKAGVSRLRVAGEDELPTQAVLTALVPYNGGSDDASNDFLIASDIDGNVAYPVVCTYADNHPSRIFVVSDLDSGIATLKSPDVRYSVTGGVVADCRFLYINWGASNDHEWASVGSQVDELYEKNPIEFEFGEENFNGDGEFVETVVMGDGEGAVDDLPADFFDV
ncbi:hypothetical protein E8E11_006983 [Didymella keratinophila]|nr:hypothetical protein E8E11_006983 [Didymella keratinophila]